MSLSVLASSGLVKICPATGCLPSMYQVLTESGSTCVQQPAAEEGTGPSAFGSCQSCAMRSEIGKPSSAYSIAGFSTASKGRLPKRLSSASQAQRAPGTVTVVMPAGGIPDPGPQFNGFPT